MSYNIKGLHRIIQTKQKKIDLDSCKISLLVHLETTSGQQHFLTRAACAEALLRMVTPGVGVRGVTLFV